VALQRSLILLVLKLVPRAMMFVIRRFVFIEAITEVRYEKPIISDCPTDICGLIL